MLPQESVNERSVLPARKREYMEQLQTEITQIVGEPVSRLECVSEQSYASLFTLYDSRGHAMPLMAKIFRCQGIAAQEAFKLSLLAREGSIRMPAVYGLMLCQQGYHHEVMLLERLGGVAAEAPARTPQRWQQLQDQIIEALLAWHRIDSHGLVGTVDSSQQNSWYAWYRQHIDALWATLSHLHLPLLTMEDRRILYQCCDKLPQMFDNFDDHSVLVHGNLTLQTVLKDPRHDQLLAMVSPGTQLWAPREYELFRLNDDGLAGTLMYRYLQRSPVDEGFVCRRWLYQVWDEAERMLYTGSGDRRRFEQAVQALLPWLY